LGDVIVVKGMHTLGGVYWHSRGKA
jgi:hypothetical protein